MTSRLRSRYGEQRFCYEAGPFGYGIQRQITGLGHECREAAMLNGLSN